MTYWTKNMITGKIYKGKANKWSEVSWEYGMRLYNPYTGKTVIGWNNYKESLRKSYNQRFGKK